MVHALRQCSIWRIASTAYWKEIKIYIFTVYTKRCLSCWIILDKPDCGSGTVVSFRVLSTRASLSWRGKGSVNRRENIWSKSPCSSRQGRVLEHHTLSTINIARATVQIEHVNAKSVEIPLMHPWRLSSFERQWEFSMWSDCAIELLSSSIRRRYTCIQINILCDNALQVSQLILGYREDAHVDMRHPLRVQIVVSLRPKQCVQYSRPALFV